MGLHRGARAPADGFTLLQNQNSQNQHQVKVVTLTLAPSRAKNRANAAWTAIPTEDYYCASRKSRYRRILGLVRAQPKGCPVPRSEFHTVNETESWNTEKKFYLYASKNRVVTHEKLCWPLQQTSCPPLLNECRDRRTDSSSRRSCCEKRKRSRREVYIWHFCLLEVVITTTCGCPCGVMDNAFDFYGETEHSLQ